VTGPNLETFIGQISSTNPDLVARQRRQIEKEIKRFENAKATAELPSEQAYWDKLIKDGKESLGIPAEIALDFNGTVPMPEELHDMTSPCPKEEREKQDEYIAMYGAGNWYDWANANWSTKWGAYEIHGPERVDPETVIYHYETAWSPPSRWLEKTSRLFPDLTFENAAADEGGMFYVVETWKNGCVVAEDMTEKQWAAIYDPGMLEYIEEREEEARINSLVESNEPD
jgi:hypothetical protein